MKHFRKWSELSDRWACKGVVIVIGILATMILGNAAIRGVYMTVIGWGAEDVDSGWLLWMGVPSLFGVIALISGWLWILIPSSIYQKSSLLRYVTVIGLGLGVSVSMFFGLSSSFLDHFFWIMLPITIIGLFLIGATLGEGARSNKSPQPTAEGGG